MRKTVSQKKKSRRVSALKTEMIYRIENIEMPLGESGCAGA